MKEQKACLRQGNFPMNVIIVMILASLTLSSCAGFMTNSKAEYTYEQGFSLFNQGRFAEAIPYFEETVALEPDFYSAHLYLGRSHLSLRNYGKALPPLRTAFRLSPQDFKKEALDILIDALLGAAFSELKEGNFQASLNYIREVLSAEPRSQKIKDDLSRVLVAVATELFKSGNLREAIKEYSEAIKINPDSSSAYVGLARALFKNGDFLKALDAAQNAVSLDPDSKEALGLIREFLK
jgi:tetratricopeptide (TPR) repeat protein